MPAREMGVGVPKNKGIAKYDANEWLWVCNVDREGKVLTAKCRENLILGGVGAMA